MPGLSFLTAALRSTRAAAYPTHRVCGPRAASIAKVLATLLPSRGATRRSGRQTRTALCRDNRACHQPSIKPLRLRALYNDDGPSAAETPDVDALAVSAMRAAACNQELRSSTGDGPKACGFAPTLRHVRDCRSVHGGHGGAHRAQGHRRPAQWPAHASATGTRPRRAGTTTSIATLAGCTAAGKHHQQDVELPSKVAPLPLLLQLLKL